MNVDSLYGRDDAMPCTAFIYLRHNIHRISYQWIDNHDLDTFHQNTTIRVGLGYIIIYLGFLTVIYHSILLCLSFLDTSQCRVEEECRVHELSPQAHHEVRKGHPRLQVWPQSPSHRQIQMVLIASNCPPLRKSEVEYLAMLAKTTVHHYSGDNSELGTACGKLFNCSVVSIIDGGDSDILSSKE